MGTRLNIVLPDLAEDEAARSCQLINEEVRRIEAMFSYFLPESEIGRINRRAYAEAVPVSKELFGALQECVRYAGLTSGAFDITMRPLITDRTERVDHDPTGEELIRLRSQLGIDKLLLDEASQSVRLASPSVRLDLGGFGKGYALERLMTMLPPLGLRNAFISFGESTVLTMGHHPNGDCWQLGVTNYVQPEQSLFTFRLNDGAMSTSSNFSVRDDGSLRQYRHVIDPATGRPVERCATVSVCSASPLEAEVLSTALLVLDDETRKSICRDLPHIQAVSVNYESGTPDVITYHEPALA